MLRIFKVLSLFMLLFTLFTFTVSAAPQFPGGGEISGVTCGVAGGDKGSDKCCSTTPQHLPKIIFEGFLRHIPGIGSFITLKEKQDQQFEDIQKQSLTACIYGQPKQSGASCTCKLSVSAGGIKEIADMCKKYLGGNEQTVCLNCAHGGGMYTGLGCVPLDVGNFITSFVLSIGIALAFLVAFLCIIYSAFILQTSQGNPERVKKAREYLTSCIVGLLLIIFSVFILQVIGVNILRIPFLG